MAVAFVHYLNPIHAPPMRHSLKPQSLEASQQSQTDLQARKICRNPSDLFFETKIFNSNGKPTKTSQLPFQPTIKCYPQGQPAKYVQTSKETVVIVLIHHFSATKMPRSRLLFLKATSILLPHPTQPCTNPFPPKNKREQNKRNT